MERTPYKRGDKFTLKMPKLDQARRDPQGYYWAPTETELAEAGTVLTAQDDEQQSSRSEYLMYVRSVEARMAHNVLNTIPYVESSHGFKVGDLVSCDISNPFDRHNNCWPKARVEAVGPEVVSIRVIHGDREEPGLWACSENGDSGPSGQNRAFLKGLTLLTPAPTKDTTVDPVKAAEEAVKAANAALAKAKDEAELAKLTDTQRRVLLMLRSRPDAFGCNRPDVLLLLSAEHGVDFGQLLTKKGN